MVNVTCASVPISPTPATTLLENLKKKMGWGGVLRNAVNDAVDTVNVTPYLSEFPSSYDILFH